MKNPAALLLFLRLAVGRLHRVSNFVISEFLCLSLPVQHDVMMLSGKGDAESERQADGGQRAMETSQRWSAEDVLGWMQGEGPLASAVEICEAGEVLFGKDETPQAFWVMLEGEITITDEADRCEALASRCRNEASDDASPQSGDGLKKESAEGAKEGNHAKLHETVVAKPCVLGARQFLTAVERKASAVASKPTRLARYMDGLSLLPA